MSNRRKDMWKLLYDLLNRNETVLDDVFSFVDDILCKQPSLMRPYSLRQINNCFQDDFIIWIISKLVRYMADGRSIEIHTKNIETQKRLLASCLINRTVMFQRLVEAYIMAIDQMGNQLPEIILYYESIGADADKRDMEVTAFMSEDKYLQEIDSNFCFRPILVSLDDSDECIQAVLNILRYALVIGYEIYPSLFTNALGSVFKVLKECDFPTKVLCLCYCRDIFKIIKCLDGQLEYYFELTVQSLALICEQMPIWQQVNCVKPQQVEEFVDVSIELLKNLRGLVQQFDRKQRLMKLPVDMLINIAEVSQYPQVEFPSKLSSLIGHLVKFTLELQSQSGQSLPLVLTEQQCHVLLCLSDDFPIVLRVLAASLLHQNLASNSNLVIKAFEKRILKLLQKTDFTLKDLAILHELLTGLIYLEHHNCLQKQLSCLQSDDKIERIREQNIYSSMQIFYNNTALEESVSMFLSTAEKTRDIELSMEQIRAVGLLLGVSTLQNMLSLTTQERLLCFVEKPIKMFLSSPNEQNAHKKELVHFSLQVLSCVSFPDSSKIYKHLQNIWRSIGCQLFAKSSAYAEEDINKLRLQYCNILTNLFVNGFISREQIMRDFLKNIQQNPSMLAKMLEIVFCGSDVETFYALKITPYADTIKDGDNHIQMICAKCSATADIQKVATFMRKNRAILLDWPKSFRNPTNVSIPNCLRPFELCKMMCINGDFAFIGHHLPMSTITADDCFHVLSTINNVSALYLPTLRIVIPNFINENTNFLTQIATLMLKLTLKSLESQQLEQQLQVLKLINCCTSSAMSEHWLFHFYKMTFFFLVHPDSCVANEAILCATEMCAIHNVQPIQLWNWYKRDALSLIVKLAVFVYLKKGVRLTRSLKSFTKMLGFSCVQEFICKYYRMLITMIVPYCVQTPQCKGLIVSISKITRKPVSTLFMVSFLRIYTHIYLTEEADVSNKCIDLIVKCTACSLTKLLNTDVKQTVSEFLIYFNRNPKFVMQAFQSHLLQESASSSLQCRPSVPSNEFAKFIADRFLGVITYFQTCLAEPNFEKQLKEEALYSLGQIIRFVGANHVTQFRFKIIAMLSFVLSLNDRHLQSICLKIWNIFLHIVNIQELGPSLSRIVASLQPLLKYSKDEVNAIYEFVILKNDSLLGAYIPDLYFVENIMEINPAIRQCVARQTEILKSEKSTLLDKIGFLHKQITNENLQVRIYGLTYLAEFIAREREAINILVLSEIRIDPLLEHVVDVLVSGCRHEDRNLQLASAKCLGELGAIDPSYMPSHFSFEQVRDMCLSVHTDDFAIMALTELCRAYQFQKDTNYVDNFSLAIQETLSICGVSPRENKKINVWEAIPERMRQVMEPFLTSCYTGSRRASKCKDQPIFNSSFCRSYEDWAFVWASRLIDIIQTEDTKHLFNSYKPSIKRDNNTLAIFFPYMLIHALQECNDTQMQHIYGEFEAVFSFSSRGYVAKPEYETSGSKEFLSAKYSAEHNNSDIRRKLSATEQYDAMENISRTCTKLCSEQIDFLQRWMREWQRLNLTNGQVREFDENYKRISGFLDKFDKQLIAKANYNSGDFARALMYLEEYIEIEPKVRLQEQISLLIEIYGNLMDADSVEGAVYMKKSNLSLAEEILVNRIVDRPQEMMTCYEQLMSNDDQINQDHIKGMINCYLRMDAPETALLITDGLWQKLTDQYTDDYFKECKFELLWRLGRYDELQVLLEDSVVRRKTSNWNVQCAEAFLLFRQPAVQTFQFNNFIEQLDVIRSNVLCTMRSCAGVNRNSYPHSYDEVIKLHLLNEVEKNKLLLIHLNEYFSDNLNPSEEKCLDEVQNFFMDWSARLAVLQPIIRIVEPVLCFRRNLLIETKRLLSQTIVEPTMSTLQQDIGDVIDDEIGKLWIRSVQMNREAGSLQQAQISIMKAAEYEPKTLFIEKAKLLWEKGDQTNTFKLIDENLERILAKCGNSATTLSGMDRALYAEAKFLQATYNAESMNICSELNLSYFKEAISGNRTSEKCYVHLAQYLEKLHDSYSPEQKDSENGHKLIFDIMVNFAKSLKYGCENVYQSLPRLLSIWLDFTAESAQPNASQSVDAAKAGASQALAHKMNDLINNCSSVLPTSIFYTAFSQLLCRICHPSDDVFSVLRTIVVKLVVRFPHQSLWMLLPILKSSYPDRIKRCKAILTDSRLAKQQFQKLLIDFNMLAERLIELSNKSVTVEQSYRLSALAKQLPKLFENPNFSNILLPFEKYMQALFPISSSATSTTMTVCDSQDSTKDSAIPANPFPYKQIFITGINEEVVVLRSAAQPKKITIRCTDGHTYDVMVKPKDDLRRDFRLMEFNGLVKRYLHQDSQARHRRLHIRTYAAIPFNEECGLVEWLPKLCSIRSTMYSIYRQRGLGIPDRMLRQYALPKERPIEEKRSMFLDKLLPRYPPVFHEWFRKRFPTPHSWYEARSSYVKTLAVMSMIGYILGLGDRHGENVLIDETNGDVVHVDFNCLFNSGENLQYPELVPFRLTHNLVFAMGPLGVEGMYRKCCEITLRVLKHEAKTLMSVLRPFVHDLMVLNTYNRKQNNGDLSNLHSMMKSLGRIEARFNGYVKKTLGNSMPLSVEGQVNFLINEATDIDNLAAMFIGWGAFL